jgi:hypothetical protein
MRPIFEDFRIVYLWIQTVKYSRGRSFWIKNFGVFRSRSQQVKTLGIGVGIGATAKKFLGVGVGFGGKKSWLRRSLVGNNGQLKTSCVTILFETNCHHKNNIYWRETLQPQVKSERASSLFILFHQYTPHLSNTFNILYRHICGWAKSI